MTPNVWTGQAERMVRRTRTVEVDADGAIVAIVSDDGARSVVERDGRGDIARLVTYEPDLDKSINWSGKPRGKIRQIKTVERDAAGDIVNVHADDRTERVVERNDKGDIVRVIEYETEN